jgi:hypothetical protein
MKPPPGITPGATSGPIGEPLGPSPSRTQRTSRSIRSALKNETAGEPPPVPAADVLGQFGSVDIQARHGKPQLRSLRQAVAQKQRVLVGFDFAYSYPLAVLECIANNQGPGNFSALWKTLNERIQDDAGNVNDRYSFAAWANEHWFKQHYFWGFPTRAHAHPWLVHTKHETRLPEFRMAESSAPGTQPTRKLAYPGSVGSQALLGMRRLHVLRNDPALAKVSHVWPMETGFSLPASSQGTALIVHAEIYPTPVPALAKLAGLAMSEAGEVNDAQQVWACVALARLEDNNGALAGRFAQSRMLRDAQVDQARKEGWILWA